MEGRRLGFRIAIRGAAASLILASSAVLSASAPADKAAGAPSTLAVELGRGVNMELIPIPPGTFLMGSEDANPNERPVHKVTITRRFCLGKYHVGRESRRILPHRAPKDPQVWSVEMGAN